MNVGSLTTRPAITITANAHIIAAAVLMRDEDTGFLVVLEDGYIVGVLTDRDIVVRSLASEGPRPDIRVRDIMSREVLVCFEPQAVEDAAAIMGDFQVRRLPVCDTRDRLVGVLCLDSIAEDYSEQLAGETYGEIVEKRQLPRVG
ncbi:MAG: CBS domain-containing protein [Roseovarius sp.]